MPGTRTRGDYLGAEHVGVKERLRRDAPKSIYLTARILRPMKAAEIRQANLADALVVPMAADPDKQFAIVRDRRAFI